MKFTLIIAMLTLASCSVSKIYNQDNYSLYEKQLSETEKALIITKGEYFKSINYFDEITKDTLRGELRIILNQRSKYDFVEIGEWFEYLKSPKKTSASKGPIKRESKYDSLGNLVQASIFAVSDSQTYFLRESWSSRVDNNKYLLDLRIYYQNGNLYNEFSLMVYEPNRIQSNKEKLKVLVGDNKIYNEDGRLIEIYNEDGKLIRKN